MHGSNLLSMGELALWDYIKGVFFQEKNTTTFYCLYLGDMLLVKLLVMHVCFLYTKEQEETMN